jgi:GT2 family glycosyltransferase
MNANPHISIIIINYNGLDYLEECLKSLKKTDYDNFEIILVDNNSIDNSKKFVKSNYPEITLIELDDNYGFAKPNNIAAKKAKGDLLLFLNNDTKVEPNFISELVKVLESDSSIAICQSLLLTPSGKVDSSGDFIDSIGIPYSSHKRVENVSEIFSAKAASMLIRKSIFEVLEGFDEKFFVSFEDVDLGWRVRILGYKIVIVPSSIVHHYGGKTIKKINEIMAFHGFKNQLANFEKKFLIKSIFLFVLIYGIRSIRVWMDYTFRGTTKIHATKYEKIISNKPKYSSIFRGIFWNLKNIRYILKKRKTINRMRKTSTQTMINSKIIKSRI